MPNILRFAASGTTRVTLTGELLRVALLKKIFLAKHRLRSSLLNAVSSNCFGAIICVHFLDVGLFDAIYSSLVPGEITSSRDEPGANCLHANILA